ncbi:MAG: hypothetical protein BJ554DRAFT_3959 [Olpidium bornovanus]|uniref:Uncharacterized protein n=1 Tax=Olpidium bornovanus TaxID=278681 RepID=A0A8H7ZNE3_9FUNG|nr:MAG: hypothetical protein BJ554DRAFT_3959 [Olpidium bornovanus]
MKRTEPPAERNAFQGDGRGRKLQAGGRAANGGHDQAGDPREPGHLRSAQKGVRQDGRPDRRKQVAQGEGRPHPRRELAPRRRGEKGAQEERHLLPPHRGAHGEAERFGEAIHFVCADFFFMKKEKEK